MVHIRLDPDMPHQLPILGLSDRAFRLYVSGVCYSARWPGHPLDISHARMFAGYRARHFITELVERGLAEWTEDRTEFRLLGDGDIWQVEASREHRKIIPPRVRDAVYERDEYACVHCGATESLSLDHIHPHSLGGSDEPSNLQTLCRSCNSKKGVSV